MLKIGLKKQELKDYRTKLKVNTNTMEKSSTTQMASIKLTLIIETYIDQNVNIFTQLVDIIVMAIEIVEKVNGLKGPQRKEIVYLSIIQLIHEKDDIDHIDDVLGPIINNAIDVIVKISKTCKLKKRNKCFQ